MFQWNDEAPSLLSAELDADAAHRDELLDEALEETFPASDPTSPA